MYKRVTCFSSLTYPRHSLPSHTQEDQQHSHTNLSSSEDHINQDEVLSSNSYVSACHKHLGFPSLITACLEH